MTPRVLIVHRHERCEGSTILGVFPDTPAGRVDADAAASFEATRSGFMSCDVVEIAHEVVQSTKAKKKAKKRSRP